MSQTSIKETPKTVGVVIIALSNPYYIHCMYNLVLSLKAQDRNIPITVVTDDKFDHLFDVQKFMIDHVVRMDGANAFAIKTNLYDLSPYDRTLYLDADMIWNPAKSLTEFLQSLKGIDFTIANRGESTEKYEWADLKEFKEKAELNQVLSLSSEVIYFEKGEKAKQVFKSASEFYSSNDVVRRRLGTSQPDEPSFVVGMKKAEVKPHAVPYSPSYWSGSYPNQFISQRDIQSRFYLVSMGGAYQDRNVVNLYNRYALIAGEKLGCQPFDYIQKRTAVAERSNA